MLHFNSVYLCYNSITYMQIRLYIMNQELMGKLSSFSLLYAEDEEGIRNNIQEILECLFKDLYLAKNGEEAFKIYEEKKPDLIITDIQMPKLNGIELIQKIRKTDSKVRIVIVSAHTDLDYMLNAVELHLVKYIIKPITEAKLIDVFEAFIESFEGAKLYNLSPSWIFDEANSLVKGPDEEHILTKKECDFLALLVRKKRIITYNEMENLIWTDDNIMTANAMRLFAKNFRKKLPADTLKNVQGIGYQLVLS